MKVGDLVEIKKSPQWGFDSNHIGLIVSKRQPPRKGWYIIFDVLVMSGNIVSISHPNFDLSVEVVSTM